MAEILSIRDLPDDSSLSKLIICFRRITIYDFDIEILF